MQNVFHNDDNSAIVYLDKHVGGQVLILASVRTPMASLIKSYKSEPAVATTTSQHKALGGTGL